MPTFNVHYINADGDKLSKLVNAETSEKAAISVKKANDGAIVVKTKLDRSGATVTINPQ